VRDSIDIFYNGILVAIVLLWVLSLRAKGLGRLIALFKRWSPAITLSLWALFVVFAAWYVLNFDSFENMHDIDEAVETAVASASNGINPYEEYVVPRFKGKYHVDVEWSLGPYNYMPIDLLTYMGAEAVLRPLGVPTWFVVANMVFAGLAMFMLRELTRTPWLPFVPLAGTVMLFYSMDNASLTLLLMTGSVYAFQKATRHAEAISLVIMALAVLTKVYAAIPFLVMLLFFVQSSAAARDWRRLSETVLAACVSVAVALLVMLPFGVPEVLDAAVFFHTSEDLRVETSAGGTLLSEIALDSPYFAFIGAGLTLAAVVAGLWARSLNDRVILAIVTFLLIAVKSSLAPLTVAGLFLALRMRELANERAASAGLPCQTSQPVVPQATSTAPADQ
jgi:hypothetical protein